MAPVGAALGAYVAPAISSQVDLGTSSLKWRNFYADNVFAGDVFGTQGFWQRNDQALAPTFLSDDVLLGSISTASAFVKLTDQYR